MQVRRIVFRQIRAILCVLIPPVRKIWQWPFFSFLACSQHLTCFVIHCLTQGLTIGELVLLYYVSRDRQNVKSVFVELPNRCPRAATCAENDTNFPIQGAIQTLVSSKRPRRTRRFRCYSFEESNPLILDWAGGSLPMTQNLSATCSCLGDFQKCSTNRLTVSFRVVSTCSTVECGMLGIRK